MEAVGPLKDLIRHCDDESLHKLFWRHVGSPDFPELLAFEVSREIALIEGMAALGDKTAIEDLYDLAIRICRFLDNLANPGLPSKKGANCVQKHNATGADPGAAEADDAADPKKSTISRSPKLGDPGFDIAVTSALKTLYDTTQEEVDSIYSGIRKTLPHLYYCLDDGFGMFRDSFQVILEPAYGALNDAWECVQRAQSPPKEGLEAAVRRIKLALEELQTLASAKDSGTGALGSRAVTGQASVLARNSVEDRLQAVAENLGLAESTLQSLSIPPHGSTTGAEESTSQAREVTCASLCSSAQKLSRQGAYLRCVATALPFVKSELQSAAWAMRSAAVRLKSAAGVLQTDGATRRFAEGKFHAGKVGQKKAGDPPSSVEAALNAAEDSLQSAEDSLSFAEAALRAAKEFPQSAADPPGMTEAPARSPSKQTQDREAGARMPKSFSEIERSSRFLTCVDSIAHMLLLERTLPKAAEHLRELRRFRISWPFEVPLGAQSRKVKLNRMFEIIKSEGGLGLAEGLSGRGRRPGSSAESPSGLALVLFNLLNKQRKESHPQTSKRGDSDEGTEGPEKEETLGKLASELKRADFDDDTGGQKEEENLRALLSKFKRVDFNEAMEKKQAEEVFTHLSILLNFSFDDPNPFDHEWEEKARDLPYPSKANIGPWLNAAMSYLDYQVSMELIGPEGMLRKRYERLVKNRKVLLRKRRPLPKKVWEKQQMKSEIVEWLTEYRGFVRDLRRAVRDGFARFVWPKGYRKDKNPGEMRSMLKKEMTKLFDRITPKDPPQV